MEEGVNLIKEIQPGMNKGRDLIIIAVFYYRPWAVSAAQG